MSKILKQKFTALFNSLKTFEGDPIPILVNLGTIPARSRLQRVMCMLSFIFIACNLLLYICYAFHNTDGDALEYFAMQATLLHFLVGYCIILKYTDTIPDFRKFIIKNFKTIRDDGRKSVTAIKKESELIEMLLYAFMAMIVITTTLFLPWTGDEDKIFFHLKCIKMYLNDSLFVKIALIPIYYHSTFAISCPMFLVIYTILQMKFQLALLIEDVESLNLLDENASELIIHDVDYQKEINRRLVSSLHHHNCIKEFKNKLEEVFYWPTFALVSSSFLFETSFLILYLSEACASSNFRLIISWLVAVLSHTLYAMLGQTVVDESERLYLAVKCTNWYNWDKKNRKLLIMFLVHTQEPLTITASGLIVVSKELIIKTYKAMYSIVTFYTSVSGN